jgi:putative transposase
MLNLMTPTMKRKRYPSDLTDAQWKRVEPLIPPAKPGGRNRAYPMRDIVDALFYLLRSGCSWRMLPHDLPAWQTVYTYFQQWRDDGTLQHIHTCLREQVRTEAGREAQPSVAIIDSQSVKTTEKGGSVGMMLAKA